MRDYKVDIWANGNREWFAKATFTPHLGNTPEATRIAFNALRNLKRRLRKEIIEADKAAKSSRLKWEVVDNQETSVGRLVQITIGEKK